MKDGVATLENIWQFLIKLKIDLPYNPETTRGYLNPPQNKDIYTHKALYLNVYSSFIQNHQKMETTQVPIN